MIRRLVVLAVMVGAGVVVQAQQPAAPAVPLPGAVTPTTSLGSDPNGNPLRKARTGHVSNYDEAKVPPYTLPDVLKMADGTPVRDADDWRTRRRPEILKVYETQIYGRLPATLPKVEWRLTSTDPGFRDGTAIRRQVLGTAGAGPRAVQIKLSVYTFRIKPGTRYQPHPALAKYHPGLYMEMGVTAEVVARRYGVYREHEGTAARALFVIDGDGIIRWSYLSPVGVNPGADGILEALEDLDATASSAPSGARA